MDSLQEDTGAPSVAADDTVVNFQAVTPGAEDDPGAAVLHLVQEVAIALRRKEDHSGEIASRTRTLLERAIEQLKRAAERIESLESDSEKCNVLIAEANARALTAEDALKRWDDRFGAIEAQMSATEFRARSAEARANKAEDMLRRVEEDICSYILEPRRSKKTVAAAA
jgi:chromosome segregation ATPase